jgi:AraC family transcriptional regulator
MPMLTSQTAVNAPLGAPFPVHKFRSSTSTSCPPVRSRHFKALHHAPDFKSTGSQPGHAEQHLVKITPLDAVKRHTISSHGMAAEIVQMTSQGKIEYRFRAPVHLLVVFEEAAREEGESYVEGLPRSSLRNLTRKITFVPAGHEYYEWHQPRALSRLVFFYLDPAKLGLFSEIGLANLSLRPRLFFENAALWDSALKLKRAAEHATPENQLYFDALGVVLMHELVRLERGASANGEAYVRGGLATYQQRLVGSYIEEHLSDQVSISTLAELTHLSLFHFCRAFKKSFGVPPHRYHTSRRIEHAKALLAKRTLSITEIGLAVGFSETSSFCAAFRKATGLTPRGYQMNFG